MAVDGAKWQPGQSGNPGGRPKRKHIVDALIAELEKPAGRKAGETKRQRLVERLMSIALTGKRSDSLAAIKLILAYTDGQPVQPVELEVRTTAQRIAERTGADVAWLIRRAEQIAAESQSA